MKLGRRKIGKTSGMVVVKMGNDDVINLVCRQAQRLDGLDRCLVDRAATPLCLVKVITGINHDHAIARFQNPDEVIHCVRLVVCRVQNETFHPRPVVSVGIFDGIDFPERL